MKRSSLFLSLALAAPFAAAAQSLDYLTFRTADGTEQSLPAIGLKLTFANGQVSAANGNRTATFALADLATMFFAQEATGITGVSATDAPLVSITNGRLNVTAPAGSRISVVTADGRLVSGDRLPQGLYIVRVNDQSFKVLSK